MDKKQQILHYYRVDEMSLREISRKTGVDRKTVTRLINAYEDAVKANPDTGIDEFLAITPKYKSRAYTPKVVRDSVTKEIDKWLKENDRRRSNGMRKQCLKCKDIHRELIQSGDHVSYYSPFEPLLMQVSIQKKNTDITQKHPYTAFRSRIKVR